MHSVEVIYQIKHNIDSNHHMPTPTQNAYRASENGKLSTFKMLGSKCVKWIWTDLFTSKLLQLQ